MAIEMTYHRKWAVALLLLCLGLLHASDESKWLGKVLMDTAAAKRYAYENNRPLLVKVGYTGDPQHNCPHCNNFEDRIFSTDTFLRFAEENRLVLLTFKKKTESDNVYKAFKSKFLPIGSTTYPFLMMCRVLDGANLDSKTLDTTQAELCRLTWGEGERYAGLKYPDTAMTVLGVPMSPEANWNPAECIALVEKFFPNHAWTSPTSAEKVQGYEDAVDLGRIWDNEHLPMKNGAYYDSDWSQTRRVAPQTGASPEFWFHFTGHQGARYFFETQNPSVTGSKTLEFTAEMFDTQDGAPVYPALGQVTSENLDALANGFWFEAPAGTDTDQLYYLRIRGTGGDDATTASFTLRYHEEHSAPEAGTISNPLWTGAVPGKWTMDLDAALAASRQDGKPVILYFVAVHWCPHCLGWEHLALATEAFADRSADYYLVAMDNRRRNGSGPSLMNETQPGGYREAWDISDDEAVSKLASIRTVEVALSRGKSPTADYPTGRIGYPTFLLARGIDGEGPLYPGIDVVARASGVWTGEPDVTRVFDQFDALYASGYAETQQYPEEANPNAFSSSGQTLEATLSDVAGSWYAKAQVVPGQCWLFEVPAVAGSAATGTLAIYDETGTTLLASRSLTLADGGSIYYLPGENATETVWLRLALSGLPQVTAIPVTATLREISDAISFSETEASIARTEDGTVYLPLQWNLLSAGHAGIDLAYQVASEYAADCVDIGISRFAWNPNDGTTAQLPIPVHVPSSREDWEGTLDFTVSLLDAEDGSYLLQEPSAISVHILSPTAARRFAGRYHVAYLVENDVDGISRGWSILEVAQDGTVEYEVQMFDGSFAMGTAILPVKAGENSASLNIEIDLQEGRSLGLDLILLANDTLFEGEPAVLEGSGTVWFDGEMDHILTATGVLYDATRTLAEVADDNRFTFLVELPKMETPAFAPDILLQETDDDALVPIDDDPLSAQFKAFQIDRENGFFTGAFRLLSGTGALESTLVKFEGILTPISPECCGITDAVASAYGSYIYEDKSYAVRVLPEAYFRAESPQFTLRAQEGSDSTWGVVAAGRRILLRRVLDDTLHGFAWQGNDYEFHLDGSSPYEAVALEEYCVESPVVRLALQYGEEMTFEPTEEQGDGGGWRMVAIPWDVELMDNQAPGVPCYTMDPAGSALVKADTLQRGTAYWLFAEDGNATLTAKGSRYATRPQLDVMPAPGWNLLAWDETMATLFPSIFTWTGTRYEPQQNPENDQPVMIFIEPEQ